MAVALLALMVALGGTSIAATKLAARSVGTKQLKKNAVARANIKNGAINGAKVAPNSLTGADINEATLVGVASALSAANAGHAGASAALDRVSYRNAPGSVGPARPDPTDPANFLTQVSGAVTASCDAGQVVTGGGVSFAVEDADVLATHMSFPSSAAAWTGVVGNDDEAAGHNFTVYAICVPAGSVG